MKTADPSRGSPTRKVLPTTILHCRLDDAANSLNFFLILMAIFDLHPREGLRIQRVTWDGFVDDMWAKYRELI